MRLLLARESSRAVVVKPILAKELDCLLILTDLCSEAFNAFECAPKLRLFDGRGNCSLRRNRKRGTHTLVNLGHQFRQAIDLAQEFSISGYLQLFRHKTCGNSRSNWL